MKGRVVCISLCPSGPEGTEEEPAQQSTSGLPQEAAAFLNPPRQETKARLGQTRLLRKQGRLGATNWKRGKKPVVPLQGGWEERP